jgi:hypothetical protein
VFAGGGGFDFQHVSFVLNVIEFKVHHHDSEDQSSLGVKPNYLFNELFTSLAVHVGNCLTIASR